MPADDVPIGVDPTIWRAIKGNRTFRPLSLDAKESLAKGIQPQTFAAGDTLLTSGQRASGLYLILDGEVEIVVVDGDKRRTIDVDGRGSVLGEISTITGEPCTADVIAITEVRALVLSADDYDAIRGHHPEVEIALSQLVSDRLGQQSRDALCGKISRRLSARSLYQYGVDGRRLRRSRRIGRLALRTEDAATSIHLQPTGRFSI